MAMDQAAALPPEGAGRGDTPAPRPFHARRSADLRVLLIVGHPRPGSLSHALADAYEAAARGAGATVERLDLDTRSFARDVVTPAIRQQAMEPDLRRAEALLAWAEHVVLVYPTWWGTMPGLLKSFLDRILRPGFAFVETDRTPSGYEGLLGGRTVHLITTMDTPRIVYRWIYGAPGHRALARATLGFCGMGPVRVTAFGPVRSATASERAGWIERVRRDGRALRGALPTAAERRRITAGAWLRALRLQFYPMVWIAYTLGALLAAPAGVFGQAAYWLGYGVLLALEAATVFANELFDLPSDRLNRNFGPFTGGSRVLVSGRLSPASLRTGIAVAMSLAAAAMAGLLWVAPAPLWTAAAYAAMAVLALGYTVPPLRLSWRGLGELDVGVTHGPGAVLCGALALGAQPSDAAPWLAGTVLGLAVIPAITLSGIPDRAADAAAGKRTLAVALGPSRTYAFAVAVALVALLAAALLAAQGVANGAFTWLPPIAAANLAVLAWTIRRAIRRRAERIDGVMATGLTLILWFGLVPLLTLW